MKSRIWAFNWREVIADRISVLGPLLVALTILVVAATRWMRAVHLTGTLSEQVVALDRERTRLGRDRAEWETDGTAGTYQVLWQSLPNGEAGMRDVMAWLRSTAARHGVALAIRVGSAESVGKGKWHNIERIHLDLTLSVPPGAPAGATRAWSDLIEELVAAGVPIQVLSASWAGMGKGLLKCELSTWIWVQSPG